MSDRELDVLRLLLGTDLDPPDIARVLSVSNTVGTRTRNIYAQLGVTNRRAAVRQAHDLKLPPSQHPA